jgi:hypothetical protein
LRPAKPAMQQAKNTRRADWASLASDSMDVYWAFFASGW